MKTIHFLILLAFGCCAAGLSAAERHAHFEGKPAPTLEQALQNLAEYNQKLAAQLEKAELSADDILEIHQLSYTLENALETFAREQARAAELLEEMHVASEMGQRAVIKSSGQAYLKAVGPLLPASGKDVCKDVCKAACSDACKDECKAACSDACSDACKAACSAACKAACSNACSDACLCAAPVSCCAK
ncbi:MAG: hypothetical protein EA353_02330 [Puniceicoccaceae bacterium]|nr:MAG: hypothetical protein EA353_02330 [Puniceicoccaceae bacterium]